MMLKNLNKKMKKLEQLYLKTSKKCVITRSKIEKKMERLENLKQQLKY